jgi:hypothetical protein
MLAPAVAIIIGVVLSSIVVFATPKGKRAVSVLGCMITFMGIVWLAEERITQRWGGGPPIEGSLATFGSILMLGVGVYIILLAFFQKSNDHS